MKKATLIYSIISVVIVVVLVIVTAIGSAGFSNWNLETWFKKGEVVTPNDPSNIPNEEQKNGGMVVTEGGHNGMSLTSTKLPKAAYEANGISPQADSAHLLMVIVNPETATNKEMDWSISWVDGNSGFASGKNVTDYVNISPTSNGGLTANIVCKQAFGSQIKVSVVSKDNPDAKAECILDYSQKVKNVSFKYGDMTVNLGGTTEIRFNINPNGNGSGGATNLHYETTDVYTIAENFTSSVKLEYDSENGQAVFMKLKGSTITTGTYNRNPESEMYFDYPHAVSNFIITGRNSDIKFKELSTSQIAGYFSDITEGRMFNLVLTIKGEHTTYTAMSKFVCVGYINQARVASIDLDNSSVIL